MGHRRNRRANVRRNRLDDLLHVGASGDRHGVLDRHHLRPGVLGGGLLLALRLGAGHSGGDRLCGLLRVVAGLAQLLDRHRARHVAFQHGGTHGLGRVDEQQHVVEIARRDGETLGDAGLVRAVFLEQPLHDHAKLERRQRPAGVVGVQSDRQVRQRRSRRADEHRQGGDRRAAFVLIDLVRRVETGVAVRDVDHIVLAFLSDEAGERLGRIEAVSAHRVGQHVAVGAIVGRIDTDVEAFDRLDRSDRDVPEFAGLRIGALHAGVGRASGECDHDLRGRDRQGCSLCHVRIFLLQVFRVYIAGAVARHTSLRRAASTSKPALRTSVQS